jgi:hypothetical protein
VQGSKWLYTGRNKKVTAVDCAVPGSGNVDDYSLLSSDRPAMNHDDALLCGWINVHIIDGGIDIFIQDAIHSSATGRLDGICPRI